MARGSPVPGHIPRPPEAQSGRPKRSLETPEHGKAILINKIAAGQHRTIPEGHKPSSPAGSGACGLRPETLQRACGRPQAGLRGGLRGASGGLAWGFRGRPGGPRASGGSAGASGGLHHALHLQQNQLLPRRLGGQGGAFIGSWGEAESKQISSKNIQNGLLSPFLIVPECFGPLFDTFHPLCPLAQIRRF